MINSTTPPAVSIIIPCYNDGKYLPEAVASALAQTYAHIELIVVDDHSTDLVTKAALAAAHERGIRVLTTPEGKKGLPAARNTGIAAATGKYILPLDADDKISPSYVDKAVAALESNANAQVCTSRVRFFGLRHHEWVQPPYAYSALVLEQYKIVATSLYRKTDWERVGGYDERLTLGKEDMVFWLDLLNDGGEVIVLPEVLFFYRIKPNSMSAATSENVTECERLSAMYVARPKIFQRYLPDFMHLCAELRSVESHRTCLFSWKLLSPVFRLEWFLRQKVKRLLGRA